MKQPKGGMILEGGFLLQHGSKIYLANNKIIMSKFNKDNNFFYNSNLLLTGGVAALGGLVIYAVVTWLLFYCISVLNNNGNCL